MAERRMFSRSVISSARFLRMPAASRLLYYDLGMDADDDGCVEAFCVIRKTGATEEDLQILADKGFVRILNDDLVSYIVDWRINNKIRPDRYHAGLYAHLISDTTNCLPDGNQSADNCPTTGDRLTTICPTDDNHMTPEYSIGESILGESIIRQNKTNTGFSPPTLAAIKAYIADNGFCIRAEDFFDYYTSNGWTIKGTKMSDWQAAVRSWNRRPGARKPPRNDDLDDIM